MKRLPALLLFATLAIGCQAQRAASPGSAAAKPDKERLAGSILFIRAPVLTVLDVFRGLGKQELAIAPEVEKNPARITWDSRELPSRGEARRKLEAVLREQAGIVITRVDENHFTATSAK